MKDHILLGRTLLGVKIASDKQALLFETDTGEVIADCEGDCCSHTWVESVELPARGFPALVTAAGDIPLNEAEDDQSGELAFYGFKIETDKGTIIVDYRNASNGYYGGNLSWPGDYHYGGVYGQNISKHEWQDIAP
jgi:hypothetical protein